MGNHFYLILILIFYCMPVNMYSQSDKSVITLANWEFSKANQNEWLPITVPGNVHTALFKNKQIQDPFLSNNEEGLQWIGKTNWKFRTSYQLNEKELNEFDEQLVFEGLDTYAEVKLNNKTILNADNMFRSWKVDLGGSLKTGTNTIEIVFTAPDNYIKSIERPLGIVFPGGERVLTRKAQYQFGWDWAPTYITMGIIKPVYINRWNKATIDKLSIDYKLDNKTANVNLDAAFKVRQAGTYTVKFSVEDYAVESELQFGEGDENISLSLTMDDINLWWPNGMGNQALYNATIELYQGDKLLDSQKRKIGFRAIELIKEKDNQGESFYFKVNGKAFFAKGANYVPPSSFPDQVDSTTLDELIKEAKESNFNMLRVWGGGYFETDEFYELCDQYGILIWQDFMFACAMYPDNPDLLENIKKEAIENVTRISGHPCMALWCGNNEISEGWARWGWKDAFTEEQQNYLSNAYNNIFKNVLPVIVKSFGKGLPYHESSPTFGRGDERYKTEGDAHDWWVWHDSKPFEHFIDNVPRFMSEFGYQSYPDMATIKAFAGNNPKLTDPVLAAHQKHPRGNDLIKSYMELEYHSAKDFESFVNLSQRLQAEGIGLGIESQRLAMPYCMGSLYWQYNDCWPSVSWASIDYFGRWKALQYKVKRLFAPVLLVARVKDNSVDFHIVSDLQEKVELSLLTEIYTTNGELINTQKMNCSVLPGNSKVNNTQDLSSFIKKYGKENLCISSKLIDSKSEILSESMKFLVHTKELKIPKSQITFGLKPIKDGYLLTLNSKGIVPGIWISTEGSGKLSDNYFDMVPGKKEIMFKTNEKIKDPLKAFKLRSLSDNWE